MITVQPIVYAEDVVDWHRVASGIGLRLDAEPDVVWAEADGDGILAIHRVDAGDALAGTVEACVLVDDVDAAAAALTSLGVAIERTMLDDIGPMLRVTSAEGVRLTITGGARPARDGLVVQPIWYQRDLDEPRRILEALGLRGTIASDAGTWIELAADGGGVVALHRSTSTVGVELAFATHDVDGCASGMRERGLHADVVDEAYDRTVRTPSPAGGELWINGPIDMHGYHRLDV